MSEETKLKLLWFFAGVGIASIAFEIIKLIL